MEARERLSAESDLTKVSEGKTKIIYSIVNHPSLALVRSKDKITCWDGTRQHDFEGKSCISTMTTCRIFEYLCECGKSIFLYLSTEIAHKAFARTTSRIIRTPSSSLRNAL